MNANKYKPVVAYKPCELCNMVMPIIKYYDKKRFCSAKCRSLVLPLPPRPDQTGFVPWNKGLNKFKDKRIQRMSESRTGNKNWSWVDGGSRAHKSMWGTSIHRAWRKAVFERDDYTCQLCHKKGGTLNADHIKCFAHHPDLRYECSNGRTLCLECHKKAPNFGMHKKEQCL